MDKEIQVFGFEGMGVRALAIDGEPWFVAKDVTEALEYANASKALTDHVDEEDKLNNESLSSLGQRGGWLVNESGMYSLILRSNMPEAKKFKRWVTSEVLPSIRKNGGYLSPSVDFTDPEIMQKVFDAWKEDRKKLEQANGRIERLVHNNTCYNSSEIAKELGFKSAQELHKILSERGIIYKDGRGVWLLYAEYCGKGFQEIKQKETDGRVIYYATWTGLGRDWLVGLLKE